MNIFRAPKWNSTTREWSRPLDLKFLRVCAAYRLLKRGVIDKARAIELIAQRHSPSEMKVLRGTVELWSIRQ